MKKLRKGEVVVILPYVKDKILMQLRDFREDIVFPGHWGFFGGSIANHETPMACAERELFEEIKYKTNNIHRLGTTKIGDLGNIVSHSFCCPLTAPVGNLELREGADLGLFTLEEVMTKKLYSSKMQGFFPVVKTSYIINTIRNLMGYLKIALNNA